MLVIKYNQTVSGCKDTKNFVNERYPPLNSVKGAKIASGGKFRRSHKGDRPFCITIPQVPVPMTNKDKRRTAAVSGVTR